MQQYDQKLFQEFTNNNQSSDVKLFVKEYLNAQKRAQQGEQTGNGGMLFLLVDKISLVEKLRKLFKADFSLTYNTMGKVIAQADQDSTGSYRVLRQRHASRLRAWVLQDTEGTLRIENAVSVCSNKQESNFEDVSKFKKNLIDSVKAVCSSGFKNYLTEDEIAIILNSGLITAKEELKVAQFTAAMHSFMREHGINKEVALQILEG